MKDVLALVGIDVGDVAIMDGGEKRGEIVEEGGRKSLAGVKIYAGDKFVHKPGGSDPTKEAWNAADALELLVDQRFAACDDAAEPFHRETVEGIGALNF